MWQTKCFFRAKQPTAEPTTVKATTPSVSSDRVAPANRQTAVQEPIPTAEPARQHRGQSEPPPQPAVVEEPRFSRSGRQIKTPSRFMESMMSIANCDGTDELWFQDMHPLLLLLKTTSNPDILTIDEAMAAPDKAKFLDAMLKEVRDHEKRGHWEVIKRKEVEDYGGNKVLPAVWAMARRREILTQIIKKWKSRLNLGGHRMQEGIDYDLTWSPVVAWPTIRLFLIFFKMSGWVTTQLDLVLAYPHADVDRPTFMEIPRGFQHKFKNGDYVLRIIKNLCGGKASGRIYYEFLCAYLADLGFIKSEIDPCIFYGRNCVLMCYVDDLILGAKTIEDLNDAIQLLQDNIDLEDMGAINDYVGIHIEHHGDEIHLTQEWNFSSFIFI